MSSYLKEKDCRILLLLLTNHGGTNAWKENPLKLLQFINRYNFANSVPSEFFKLFLSVLLPVRGVFLN